MAGAIRKKMRQLDRRRSLPKRTGSDLILSWSD
jgi:hypothetical protein